MNEAFSRTDNKEQFLNTRRTIPYYKEEVTLHVESVSNFHLLARLQKFNEENKATLVLTLEVR